MWKVVVLEIGLLLSKLILWLDVLLVFKEVVLEEKGVRDLSKEEFTLGKCFGCLWREVNIVRYVIVN